MFRVLFSATKPSAACNDFQRSPRGLGRGPSVTAHQPVSQVSREVTEIAASSFPPYLWNIRSSLVVSTKWGGAGERTARMIEQDKLAKLRLRRE